MAYKLTFSHPDFPFGKRFGLTGLGSVENGKAMIVNEELARRFQIRMGKPLTEHFEGNGMVKIEVIKGGGDT